MTRKHRSHVRILINRTCPIETKKVGLRSHVKFAFMTLKPRSRVILNVSNLGYFPTDTAPYVSFSGNQALQSHYMNISRGRDRSCLPYAKSFQKIQLASKWNMTFQVTQIVSNRISEKATFFCSKCSKQKFVFHFIEVFIEGTFDTSCRLS